MINVGFGVTKARGGGLRLGEDGLRALGEAVCVHVVCFR